MRSLRSPWSSLAKRAMDSNDENEQGADTPAPDAHQADPEEPQPRRAWWAIPLAVAGALAVKYFTRRGEELPRQEPTPEPDTEPERIIDADFTVREEPK